MYYYVEVLKKYATFEGRARRTEYWMFILFNALIRIALQIVSRIVPPVSYLASLYGLAVLIPGIAVTARRLHDIEKSGWLQLIGIIPIIGWIPMLIWTCTEGTIGDNLYGEDPKRAEFESDSTNNY